MSSVPCEQLVPQIDKNGIETVYSTFSLEQFSDKKSLICNHNSPYSWCLNKICTVDPMNPEKALCICDVKRQNSPWTTLGGDCDSSTCQNAYWSGASLLDLQNGMIFYKRELPQSVIAHRMHMQHHFKVESKNKRCCLLYLMMNSKGGGDTIYLILVLLIM